MIYALFVETLTLFLSLLELPLNLVPKFNGFFLGSCPILPTSFHEIHLVVFLHNLVYKQTNQQTGKTINLLAKGKGTEATQ